MQDSVPAHTFANQTDKHACFNKTERNNEAEAPDLDFYIKTRNLCFFFKALPFRLRYVFSVRYKSLC